MPDLPLPPGPRIESVLTEVVAELTAQGGSLATPLRTTAKVHPLPSRLEIIRAFELLRAVIFPGFFGETDLSDDSLAFHTGATLDRAAQILFEQIRRGLCFQCQEDREHCTLAQCDHRARAATTALLRELPSIRRLLALDAVAAYEGDPAAPSPSEAIFCSPGVHALTSHRIAHCLHRLSVPLIPRIIAEHAHSRTGVDIHPGAVVGERLFIDHGTGVVIGATCEIGDRVRIYQGVTLGAKSFPLDASGLPVKGVARHPIVEDDVTIYAGATILGRIRIGRGSVIGGNVWLTRSTAPGSRIVQARNRPELFAEGGGI